MWAGIAAQAKGTTSLEVAISIHDGTYSTDYAEATLDLEDGQMECSASKIEDHIIKTLRTFSNEHVCKFIGAGVTVALLKDVPNLCTRLWLEVDIVPIVFDIKPYAKEASATRTKIKHSRSVQVSGSRTPVASVEVGNFASSQVDKHLGSLWKTVPILRTLDEQADSAARKCVVHFGGSLLQAEDCEC